MGVTPDLVTRTSTHFPLITKLARQLLKDGKAFMDCTPQEQLQKERFEGVNSQYRDATVEENLRRFDLMISKYNGGAAEKGKAKGEAKGKRKGKGGKKEKNKGDGKKKEEEEKKKKSKEEEEKEKERKEEENHNWFMRAKISMTDKNSAMRDPAMFRLGDKPHPHTGESTIFFYVFFFFFFFFFFF